ncbi:hypothetical protein BJX62DRAFT_236562 [Aspergillus germanicus]
MPFIRNSSLPVTSLDINGYNLDTGFVNGEAEPERAHDSAIVQALFPSRGAGPGWRHLTLLTIRMCGHPEGDRLTNILASAPNLKRLTLLGDGVGFYMKQIADIEAEFRAVLRGQRTTLKKLTLSHVATGPDVDLLRFLIDADLSALEEITIDNV